MSRSRPRSSIASSAISSPAIRPTRSRWRASSSPSGLSAAIGYYGGAIVRFADDKPKVPTQLHFGEKDAGIPLGDVETIRAKRPEVDIYIYPGAQHGFHCDERASYDKASADTAWPRSLDFLARHLKK
jgi:carboxymethylenebutenolidase